MSFLLMFFDFCAVLMGKLLERGRIRQDIIYYVATHKYAALRDGSPCEAIKNNVMGTCKIAYSAMTRGCKCVVLINMDKTVNLTNIMETSKCVREIMIQKFGQKGKVYFVFGAILTVWLNLIMAIFPNMMRCVDKLS